MKVLIVDDSKTIGAVVSEMLNELGHTPLQVFNGQEAIEYLKENDVDLILLDWNMPVMTGIEFLEFNTQHKVTQSPILMMTTENSPDHIMKALGQGVREYIMKPFTKDILAEKIQMSAAA